MFSLRNSVFVDIRSTLIISIMVCRVGNAESMGMDTCPEVYAVVTLSSASLPLLDFSYPPLHVPHHHLICYTSMVISSDIPLFDQDKERLDLALV